MGEGRGPRLDRRGFLLGSAAGAASLIGGIATATTPAATEPRVRRFVPLGRTDMKVGDISFGSSRMSDPKVVRHAFERGVNYFDSAEGYKGGDSELAIGKALHDVRNQVFITSKTQARADMRFLIIKSEQLAKLIQN